jgi:hypothetical protein
MASSARRAHLKNDSFCLGAQFPRYVFDERVMVELKERNGVGHQVPPDYLTVLEASLAGPPRWQSLVRFPLTSLSSDLLSLRLGQQYACCSSENVVCPVQLCVQGDWFVLARRMLASEGKRPHWLLFVGHTGLQQRSLEQPRFDQGWHCRWPVFEGLSAPSTGRKRGWPWRRPEPLSMRWSYEFALDPDGHFLYGLASSGEGKFRLDWRAVPTVTVDSFLSESDQPSVDSAWLLLPTWVLSTTAANAAALIGRTVLWSVNRAAKQAATTGLNTTSEIHPSGSCQATDDRSEELPSKHHALHLYTAGGWHFCWVLDAQTGAPLETTGMATALGATIHHGWKQHPDRANESQTWLLGRQQLEPSKSAWVLLGGAIPQRIASWCDPTTFPDDHIDVGVVNSDGSRLFCGSSRTNRVAIYDLRSSTHRALLWTGSERVQMAVPWSRHGILLALTNDEHTSNADRLECWRWDLAGNDLTDGPVRVFSLQASAVLPTTSQSLVADAHGQEEEEAPAETTSLGATRSLVAEHPFNLSSNEASRLSLQRPSVWQWLQSRLFFVKRHQTQMELQSRHGSIQLQSLMTIDRDHALLIVIDREHGQVIRLEQLSPVRWLAEALQDRDWERARRHLAEIAIPEAMLALFRWRCSLRDADAARALVAALPEACQWVAAYEAIHYRAATASAKRVLLRAGRTSSIPTAIVGKLGITSETLVTLEHLANILVANTIRETDYRTTMFLYRRCGFEAVVCYFAACGAFDAIGLLREQQVITSASLISALQMIPRVVDPHRYATLVEQWFRHGVDPMAFASWCLDFADQLDTFSGSLRHVQRLLAMAVSLMMPDRDGSSSSTMDHAQAMLSKHLQATVRMREALLWECWQDKLNALSWRSFISMEPEELLERLVTALVSFLHQEGVGRSTDAPRLSDVLGSDLVMHMLEGYHMEEAHALLESILGQVLREPYRGVHQISPTHREQVWLRAFIQVLQTTPVCTFCPKLRWPTVPFTNWCWSRLARTILLMFPLTEDDSIRLGAALKTHHGSDAMMATLSLSDALAEATWDPSSRLQLRQSLWQARLQHEVGTGGAPVSLELRKRIRQCYAASTRERSGDALHRLEALLGDHGLRLTPTERLACLVASYREDPSLVGLLIASMQESAVSGQVMELLWSIALNCFVDESYPPECTEQLLQAGAIRWRGGSVAQQIRIRSLLQTVRMFIACRDLGLPVIKPRRLAWQVGPAAWVWHFYQLLEASKDASVDDAVIQVASLAGLDTLVHWLLARCGRAEPLALLYHPLDALDWLCSNVHEVIALENREEVSPAALGAVRRLPRAWVALARRLLREAGPWQLTVARALYDSLTGQGSLLIDLAWMQRYYGCRPCPTASVLVSCSSSPVAIAQEARQQRLAVPAILYRVPLESLDPESWLDTSIAIWILRQPHDVAVGRARSLPPAGDIRQLTCLSLADETAALATRAATDPTASKFLAAAKRICDAYSWLAPADESMSTAVLDAIEGRVRRFLSDAAYREEVILSKLAYHTDVDRLEELAQPVIASAARLEMASSHCRLAHIRWILEQADARNIGAHVVARGEFTLLQRESVLVELLVQHDGLGEELSSIAHKQIERAEGSVPHPLVYVMLALTERNPRASYLADWLRAGGEASDPELLWFLYQTPEKSSTPLVTLLHHRPNLTPETAFCIWRVAVRCDLDLVPLLGVLLQRAINSREALAVDAIREWFFDMVQPADSATRFRLLLAWAKVMLAHGSQTEEDCRCVLEWLEERLADLQGGDPAQTESRYLLLIARRVLEYMQALWNDRALAAAGVSAALCVFLANSFQFEQRDVFDPGIAPDARPAALPEPTLRTEHLADEYVAKQTLSWLQNQTPAIRQQWSTHLEAIFAIANATVSWSAVISPTESFERSDQALGSDSDSFTQPASMEDTSPASVVDPLVERILQGDLWGVGWQRLVRRGWCALARTPEQALVLVQQDLEASLTTMHPTEHVSDATRSAAMRALALVCEWRTAFGIMGD